MPVLMSKYGGMVSTDDGKEFIQIARHAMSRAAGHLPCVIQGSDISGGRRRTLKNLVASPNMNTLFTFPVHLPGGRKGADGRRMG